jgi:hypothetical protein
LQAQGESTEGIASVKDLQRVARAEWQKAPPADGAPSSWALFLCDGDVPASVASETRALSKAQGQIEDILVVGEDCLRTGRLEQARAHAARASSELERVRGELERTAPQKGLSPLEFLSVRLARLEKATHAAREARESQTQLEVFRRRLEAIEESLRLKVPPADLIQQAEILVDSSRNEGERAEALSTLQECQDRVARHLLETASEFLSSGEKEVALGLLQRALNFESRVTDEVRLRIASLRRDELEDEICRKLMAGEFDDARAKISLLRSVHPVYEPVAARLENELRTREATDLVEQVIGLCGGRSPSRDVIVKARGLFDHARSLHPRPGMLRAVEETLRAQEARHGLAPGADDAPADAPQSRRRRTKQGASEDEDTRPSRSSSELDAGGDFSLEPPDDE